MSETTNALPIVTDTSKAALPVDLPVIDQTVMDPPPPSPPEEPKAEAKTELLLPLVISSPQAEAIPSTTDVPDVIARAKPEAISDDTPANDEPLQPTPQDTEKEEPAAPPNKMMVVAKALRSIEQNLANIIRLLEEGNGETKMENGNGLMGLTASVDASLREAGNGLMQPTDGRVVEGVFDGMQMVGSDGKTYMVPANYASKSKLVEGDMLKLTITSKGSFIYKQIGPIERSRVVASLGFDQTIGEFYATCDNRRWAVLKASVTYFRGEPGDEIVILVPKANPSKWAAVENIIKLDPLAGKM